MLEAAAPAKGLSKSAVWVRLMQKGKLSNLEEVNVEFDGKPTMKRYVWACDMELVEKARPLV